MRRYDKGVIVGEIDAPTETIEQWARRERELATDKLNVKIDGPLQVAQNTALNGRISVLTELLYEIERRKPSYSGINTLTQEES